MYLECRRPITSIMICRKRHTSAGTFSRSDSIYTDAACESGVLSLFHGVKDGLAQDHVDGQIHPLLVEALEEVSVIGDPDR